MRRTSTKSIDQIDLLREQKKFISGEVALHSSALKLLSEEAAHSPNKQQIHDEIMKLNEEIKAKNDQIAFVEKQIAETMVSNYDKMDKSEMSQTISELASQLNEKSFELEVKTADNRIIQDQFNQKCCECETLLVEINSLKQQLSVVVDTGVANVTCSDSQQHGGMQSSVGGIKSTRDHTSLKEMSEKLFLRAQATEIEELKEKVADLTETNDQLEQQNKKLAEESSYAKELASAAAVTSCP